MICYYKRQSNPQKQTKLQRSIIILLVIFFSVTALASTSDINQPSNHKIKVGVLMRAPFTMEKNGDYSGLAVDIWQLVAKHSNWQYQYAKQYQDVNNAFKDLDNHTIDILIGPLPVDYNGLASVNFSRPFFIDRVGIISRDQPFSLLRLIKFIFKNLVDYHAFIFIIIFVVFSHLIWFIEWRRTRKQNYRKGIGHAFWFSFLSFFIWEAAEPDKVDTVIGRILLAVWLLISVLTLALITASITSALTVSLFKTNRVLTTKDLTNQPIAYVKSDVDIDDIYKLDALPIAVNTIDQAMKLLEDKIVVAIVADLPSAKYYLINHPQQGIYIPHDAIYYMEYAFAFPRNSSFRETFDLAFDTVKSQEHLTPICARYVGTHNGKFCNL